MPGMDGIETAQRIRERHPDVVVVLISVDESPAIESSGAAPLVRKREFGPAMLRRLWRTYRKSN
jgi:CheY-like chemotaxis protein